MTIFDRENPYSTLPQLEALISEMISVTDCTKPLVYSQCTKGGYNQCYRVGNMVFCSFNFNITTATAGYDYVSGLPKPLGGNWACSGVISDTAKPVRLFVTPSGTLRSDGTPYTGWVNGSVAYITSESL